MRAVIRSETRNRRAARALARAAVVSAVLAGLLGSAPARAQTAAPPVARLTIDEAVRLAVERNQALRAQRLTIDMAKACLRLIVTGTRTSTSPALCRTSGSGRPLPSLKG